MIWETLGAAAVTFCLGFALGKIRRRREKLEEKPRFLTKTVKVRAQSHEDLAPHQEWFMEGIEGKVAVTEIRLHDVTSKVCYKHRGYHLSCPLAAFLKNAYRLEEVREPLPDPVDLALQDNKKMLNALDET